MADTGDNIDYRLDNSTVGSHEREKMNTAWKIILSVWLPILIIAPVSLIELKTNIQMDAGGIVGWSPVPLYTMPWFWYVCAVFTGIFLLFFWKTSKPVNMPDQKQK